MPIKRGTKLRKGMRLVRLGTVPPEKMKNVLMKKNSEFEKSEKLSSGVKKAGAEAYPNLEQKVSEGRPIKGRTQTVSTSTLSPPITRLSGHRKRNTGSIP